MKKAHHFASNAVPLLARILLCLAFIPAGWHHAMNWTQFQGAEAERLQQLGVTSAIVGPRGEALVRLDADGAPQQADGSALQDEPSCAVF